MPPPSPSPALRRERGRQALRDAFDDSRNQTPSPAKRGRVGEGAAPQRTNFELDPRAPETL